MTVGAPGRCDLTLTAGDDLAIGGQTANADGTTYSIAGWTIASMVRQYPDSTVVLATFTVVIANQTTNRGQFTMSLSHTVTAALPTGRFAWDVQATDPSGSVYTWASGSFTVLADVTR